MAFSRDAKTEYDGDTTSADDTSADYYFAAVKDKNGTPSDAGVSLLQLASLVSTANVAGPIFPKDPNSTVDYHLDLSTYLGSDTISGLTTTVPAGLTKLSDSYTDTTCSIWLSGGASGASYNVIFWVSTTAGRYAPFVITIQVDGSGTWTKHPNAVLDYAVDFTDWLAGDTIDTYTVTAPSGITKDSDSDDGSIVTIWLSGGTHASDYTILVEIDTVGGRSNNTTLTIQVRDYTYASSVRYEYIVTESLSPYAVSASQTSGMFANTGATDEIVLTLPAAVRGLEYEIASEAAQKITVHVTGSNVIDLMPGYALGSGRSTEAGVAGAGLISSGTVGEFLTVRCFYDGQWVVCYSAGDWYDAPRINLDTGTYAITGTSATLVPA